MQLNDLVLKLVESFTKCHRQSLQVRRICGKRIWKSC